MEIMKIYTVPCELLVTPLPAVHRITMLFRERKALLWPLDFVFVFGSSSSSSSKFITSTAEGTGSSSMLVTEQGAGSDAMEVSRGGWNQNIKKERND